MRYNEDHSRPCGTEKDFSGYGIACCAGTCRADILGRATGLGTNGLYEGRAGGTLAAVGIKALAKE